MATYTVRQGEDISDVCLNMAGDISSWSDVLNANFFNAWSPQLFSGQILQIPASTTTNLNNIRALNQYPANNFTVPDIVSQINTIFDMMNGD